MKLINGISLKLFAGFMLTSELRMHLNHSPAWKEAEILKNDLQLIHFEEKEYVGHYLDNSMLQLKDLKYIEEKLRHTLAEICPAYKQEKTSIYLFSQPFIH